MSEDEQKTQAAFIHKLLTKTELIEWRLTHLEDSHKEMFLYIKKIVWLVMSLIIASVIGFIIQGGLIGV